MRKATQGRSSLTRQFYSKFAAWVRPRRKPELRRSLSALFFPLLACMAITGCASGEEDETDIAKGEYAYKHGPPSGNAPWDYYLTCYGGPSDSSAYLGTPACGGKKVNGNWWYSTGAYSFGCNAKLELSANGKCTVVEVVDNGPAGWVETKAAKTCGGTGYIIDASPLVTKYLYGMSCAGFSDCVKIKVRPVDKSTPAGPSTCIVDEKFPQMNIKIEMPTINGQARDFCQADSSKDIFDLWAGQTAIANVVVKNQGTAVARNTTVGLWFEEPYLKAKNWKIESDWQNNGAFKLNDMDAQQSVARTSPGQNFKLNIGSISPGETKRIALQVTAGEYSIGLADHPDVRAWIAHIDDFYEKGNFESAANNVKNYQKQNGGDLRFYYQTDVFSKELADGKDNNCNGEIDEKNSVDGNNNLGAIDPSETVNSSDVSPSTSEWESVDTSSDNLLGPTSSLNTIEGGCAMVGAPQANVLPLFFLLALALIRFRARR